MATGENSLQVTPQLPLPGRVRAASGLPLVVLKCINRFKFAALLAEPGHLPIDVQAEAAHVVLTYKEALVVCFLIPQQTLASLNLCAGLAASLTCLRWRTAGRSCGRPTLQPG